MKHCVNPSVKFTLLFNQLIPQEATMYVLYNVSFGFNLNVSFFFIFLGAIESCFKLKVFLF